MKVSVCLSLVLVALVVPLTFAQSSTPTHEVFGGYSWLTDGRHGWVASLSERVDNSLWIKTEVGGNYRQRLLFDGSSHPDFVHSILAGPEFKLRKDSRLVPWAHALAGITLNNYPVPAPPPLGSGVRPGVRGNTDVRFGFQPGGGVDYYLTPKFGVRTGADYRPTTASDFFRLQGGFVSRFGGR